MTLARQRDAMVLNLKIRGDTWQEIADQMGFANHSMALRCWKRAINRHEEELVVEYRLLDGARLEALWKLMFAKAQSGNHLAVDRCLLILERRAKLYGLDAPLRSRIEVTGADQLLDAVEALERSNRDMEHRIAAQMAGMDDDDVIDAELVGESPGGERTQLVPGHSVGSSGVGMG